MNVSKVANNITIRPTDRKIKKAKHFLKQVVLPELSNTKNNSEAIIKNIDRNIKLG